MYFIERLGRRKMLFIGSAGEITCALIAAFAGHFMLASTDTPADQYTKKNTTGGQLLIAFAIIQIAFFGSFWGPVPCALAAFRT
jgi:SP family sugar:H+ symporter-like MFS transporter